MAAFFVGSTMAAAQSDHNQLAELIAAHEERLSILRIQAARKGDDTPAEITAEIGRIADELAQLRPAAAAPLSVELVEELGPVGRYQVALSNIMRLDADIGRVSRDVRDLDARVDHRFEELRAHIDARLDTLLLALASASQPVAQPPRRHPPVRIAPKARR